ncbi:MAG: hypothetical protein IJ894_01345 [Bacteroidales bacterium]|nr:hypothetical protein [Bacteroidales bacterium]MBR3714205.1 hypothetical protein [Bacteroidales bacterium]
MKTLKTIILMLFAVCLFGQTFAQDYLSDDQKKFIGRRAAQKTGQMNNYISYMVDEGYSMKEREDYMQSAKDLFLGRAEEYYEEGYWKIVNMQVTSLYNPTRTYPVKLYFESLVGLIKRGVYDCAKINTTEIADMQVSTLRHVYGNEYECTVAYVQTFCGYKDGRPLYCDRTKKNMKCRVYLISDGDGGSEIEVYLSDCHATETTRIKPSDITNGDLLIPDR